MRLLVVMLMCVSIHVFGSEPAVLNTSTGKLYGELLLPEGEISGQIVLIIAGSGPTDRDGNSNLLPGKNNSLKMLAEALAQNGIASLRYDKRGVGLSKEALIKEEDVTFEGMINDALGWLQLLKSDGRFNSFYVAGHSQGALIASILPAREAMHGVICISGTSLPADEILEEQLKGLPQGLDIEAKHILEELRKGNTVSQITMFLANAFRPSVQPFLISWMKYSPKDYMTTLKTPCLVVHGENDIQVPSWHADSLASQNDQVKLFKVSGMNHVLKDAPMQRDANLATYGNPALNLSAGLSDAIASFIKSN